MVVVLDAVEDCLMHDDGSAGALDVDTFVQAPDLLLNHFSTVLMPNCGASFVYVMVTLCSFAKQFPVRFVNRFLRRFLGRFVRQFLVSRREVTVNVM